jgi:tetratricopeptide (TPR) repeat protein
MHAIKSGNINLEEMEDEAIRLLETGKLRRAERMLGKILAIDANSITAHFQLARVYWRTGEYERALRHARRTLKLSPEEPNACLNLGLIYDLMGLDRLAIFYYKRELSRNPGSPETLWNIGRLYFRKHRWLQASKYLRRCFEMGFEFEIEDTLYKLGSCYYKLHDIQSYIEVYTHYIQMVPNAVWAFANLGCALLHAKDYKGAALRLGRASQLGIKKSVAVELAQAKKMFLKELALKRARY